MLSPPHPPTASAHHENTTSICRYARTTEHAKGLPAISNNSPSTGVFFLLLLLAGYAGLTSLQVDVLVNDKVLHLLTFFILTVVFYWITDTNRRRTLHFTLVVCTLGLGVGSEFLQGFLPNGREFDFYDIVANVVGSLAALGICSWYHKRMLERKRLRKSYSVVPNNDNEDDVDIELGEGVVGAQETGVTADDSKGATTTKNMTLEEEVDNWDENAPDDWDTEAPNGAEDHKKRAD